MFLIRAELEGRECLRELRPLTIALSKAAQMGQWAPPVKSIVIDQLGTGPQPTTDGVRHVTLSSPGPKCFSIRVLCSHQPARAWGRTSLEDRVISQSWLPEEKVGGSLWSLPSCEHLPALTQTSWGGDGTPPRQAAAICPAQCPLYFLLCFGE